MKRVLQFTAAALLLAGIVYAQSVPTNATSAQPGSYSSISTTGNATVGGSLSVTGTATTNNFRVNGSEYVDGGASAGYYTANLWDAGRAFTTGPGSALCLDGTACTRKVWFDAANNRLTLTAPVSDYISLNRNVELLGGVQVYSALDLVTGNASITTPYTDSTGTPGAATIAKMSGASAIAALAGNVDITNSLVAATDRVFITPMDNDATCVTWKAVPTTGHITVTCSAGPTATFKFNWMILR